MLTTIGVSLGGPIAADISASFLALSSCCVRLATNRNPKIGASRARVTEIGGSASVGNDVVADGARVLKQQPV
jgi:hypothetical protein